MQVELVDFISIPTRDTARAVAWYRDVLELPESAVSEGEVETPNVTLCFFEPEQEDLPFVANEAGIALRVADVAAVRLNWRRRAFCSSPEFGTPASATSPRFETRMGTF